MISKYYNEDMRIKSYCDILEETEGLSGQELTKFIDVINEEFKRSTKEKEPPAVTLYYRDLLTYLIKTYGH